MHERGVRGVRCNLINPGGLSPAVVAWQPALRAMGWHVELHLAVDRRPDWADVVESFDIPVVIDHMGRPTPVRSIPRRRRSRSSSVSFVQDVFRETVRTVSTVTTRLASLAHHNAERGGGRATAVDRRHAARARVPRGQPSACCGVPTGRTSTLHRRSTHSTSSPRSMTGAAIGGHDVRSPATLRSCCSPDAGSRTAPRLSLTRRRRTLRRRCGARGGGELPTDIWLDRPGNPLHRRGIGARAG